MSKKQLLRSVNKLKFDCNLKVYKQVAYHQAYLYVVAWCWFCVCSVKCFWGKSTSWTVIWSTLTTTTFCPITPVTSMPSQRPAVSSYSSLQVIFVCLRSRYRRREGHTSLAIEVKTDLLTCQTLIFPVSGYQIEHACKMDSHPFSISTGTLASMFRVAETSSATHPVVASTYNQKDLRFPRNSVAFLFCITCTPLKSSECQRYYCF